MTDLIEKASKDGYEQYMDGLIGCCEPSWDDLPDAHKRRLIHANKMVITTILREMMQHDLSRLDLVLHDLRTPNTKESKQWLREFNELTVKAFAKANGIQLGWEDG